MYKESFMNFPTSQTSNSNFIPSENKEGDNENLFESSFTELAYTTLSTKFPELVDSIKTFKVLESDIEKGLAIGSFIIQYRTEDIYVPVVLFEDNVKPVEIMYSKRLDKFLPLKKEWLDVLISSNMDSLGESVKTPDSLPSDIDISKMIVPPIEGRYGYASLKEDLNFLDFLENEKDETKLAFQKILKKRPELLKFACEKFDSKRVINAIKVSQVKTAADPMAAGMTELVVVDNETPTEAVKEVFGDKTEEAMKMLVNDGFAYNDNRTDTNSVYATDTKLQLEKAMSPGTYLVYKSDGTAKPVYIFPPKNLKVTDHCCPQVYCNDTDGLILCENGDYYRNYYDTPVTSVISLTNFGGKVKDVIFGEKSETPKVGDTIVFIRSGDDKPHFYGPMKIGAIITGKDNTKTFHIYEEYKDSSNKNIIREVITYKNTPTNRIIGKSGNSGGIIIPTKYRILVLGENLSPRELFNTEKDVLRQVQDRLLLAGGTEVKVANLGHGEYSINRNFGIPKKAALKEISTTYKVAAVDALKILNNIGNNQKTSFYVLSKEAQSKFGSIFEVSQDPTQLDPAQAQQLYMDQQMGNPSQMMMGDPSQMMMGDPSQMMMGDPNQQAMPEQLPPMFDPAMMNMVPQENAQTQDMASPIMESAMQLNNPELFDVGAIASLAHTSSIKDLLSVYIPHLEKSLDSLGRILLTFWMQGTRIKDELGNVVHQQIEDNLRETFKRLGDIILKLGKNSLLLQDDK